MKNSQLPKTLILLIFGLHVVGVIPLLFSEFRPQLVEHDGTPGCTSCILLLCSILLILASAVFLWFGRTWTLFVSSGVMTAVFICNSIFLLDGFERRSAVVHMGDHEILRIYYEYWEVYRISEYALVISMFLTIILIVAMLRPTRTN
jgi:hypothetical protein